jgi:hypothetical protein
MPLDPEILELSREIAEELLTDICVIFNRRSQESDDTNTSGDNGFGGISANMGNDTDGDGYVQGEILKGRIEEPRTQFNFAETLEADVEVSRERMLLALPHSANIGLEDRVIRIDPEIEDETKNKTYFAVLSFFNASEQFLLHLIVQNTSDIQNEMPEIEWPLE